MKKISIHLVWLCISIAGIACDNSSQPSKKDNNDTKVEVAQTNENKSLTGVKWKLVSFEQASSGTTKIPEPISEHAYSIMFNDDKTFTAKSSTNDLQGNYTWDKNTGQFQINNLRGTEINELYDGKLFATNLVSVKHFLLEENTLKLYYNEKDYLLFSTLYPKELDIQDFSKEFINCIWRKFEPEKIHIINTEEELSRYMSCEVFPTELFKDNSLLLVTIPTTSGVHEVSTKLHQLSSTDYVLAVDITLNMTTVAQGVGVSVIIPKIDEKTANIKLIKKIHY